MQKLRKFVADLQAKNGGIATTSGGESDPNNGWLIRHLLELGMGREALKFSDYLLKHQNADGGWGMNGQAPSMISLTANALRGLCDAGISVKDVAVTKAIGFLLANQQKESGFSELVDTGLPWMKPGVVWGWITAVAVDALYKAGIRITTPAFDDASLFVRRRFWENREGVEGQSIMIRTLRNTGFAVKIETKEMKRRIDCEEQAENGGFPKGCPNLDTTLNILSFLYDIGVREEDKRFSNTVDFVVASRNKDGGWPAAVGEKSVFWASLESALLLKNLGKFG